MIIDVEALEFVLEDLKDIDDKLFATTRSGIRYPEPLITERDFVITMNGFNGYTFYFVVNGNTVIKDNISGKKFKNEEVLKNEDIVREIKYGYFSESLRYYVEESSYFSINIKDENGEDVIWDEPYEENPNNAVELMLSLINIYKEEVLLDIQRELEGNSAYKLPF